MASAWAFTAAAVPMVRRMVSAVCTIRRFCSRSYSGSYQSIFQLTASASSTASLTVSMAV